MHIKYTNQEQMPNGVKPHDNICNTQANVRFLIKTKIV